MSDFAEKFSLWKTRLLDTSRRNRLLYLTPRRGQVQVIAPAADEIFASLVHKSHKLTFVARSADDGQKTADNGPQTPQERPLTDDARAIADIAGSQATIAEDLTDTAIPSQEILEPSADAAPVTDEKPARSADVIIGETFKVSPAAREPSLFETPTVSPDTRPEPPPDIPNLSTNTRVPRSNELVASLTETRLTTALYNMRSRARTALEEQGVNVLFLSFGILNWTDPATHEAVRSPLLLVPVQLERTSVTQPFALQVRDEDMLLNPTLTYKLYSDFRIQLPRLPDESETLLPDAFLNTLRETLQPLPAWTITSEVYLELFSFEKLVMVRDLEAHEAEIAAHPILQALAGDISRLPAPPPDLPRANELDEKTEPLKTFQVLDADSSQQVAIEWSKRGASFVIEGPPGTGKSQTIANIIAEALAQNKKVLFVSAKMAALDVVAKRLASCGLENFYLEAHSHHSSRGTLVSDLGQALYETYPEQAPALERLTQLGELRGQLNTYAHALHAPVPPLQQTPFHAYASLAPLIDAPDLYFELGTLPTLDVSQFQALDETLDNLAGHAQEWETQAEHAWRGVTLSTYTFQARTNIEYRFGELIQILTPLESAAAKLADALTLSAPQSLQAIERLSAIAQRALETPAPPTAWFRAGETTELRGMAIEAERVEQEYAGAYAEFSAHFTDALLERTDLAALLTRFQAVPRSPLRIFDSQYRQDLKTVRETSRTRQALDAESAIVVIQQAQALQKLKAWMEARRPELVARFGRAYQEQGTDWAAVRRQLGWVDDIVALFAPETVPESFTNLVCNRPARVNAIKPFYQEFQDAYARFKPEWEFLAHLFPDAEPALYAGTLTELRAWLGVRLERIGDLEGWLGFQKECQSLERMGAGSFLESARAAQLQGDQLKPAFLKRFYPLWLDVVYAQTPLLQQNQDTYTRRVAQFCRADVEQQTIARERLIARLAAARPAVAWSDAPSSEVTLLKRELAKRKHHKSFRRLASEIPNLLLALKPCLMMSPLSVSQYLASAPVEFDLLIFDEASQIPPEEAIAAIVRAKQIIVAGDHQQLPPTPFFQTLGEQEDEDVTDTGVLESLLQEAAVVLPSVRLMWHYRSRHEGLLGFSNHYFYEDRLITFPNAALHDARLGVDFLYVPEGVYDRAGTRTNPIEAQRVAALVAEHFATSPERSLGVVTFSQAQRAAIDAELQKLQRARPELEMYFNGKNGDAFFCKSLENVQGDERDVMFFSVGYGKDAGGALTMNFGPLNGEDGARRLNVAITRAREQVKLISSILPSDLDAARTTSKGVQLLRAYMEYASRQGRTNWTVAHTDPTRTDADEAQLRDSIQAALSAQGLVVQQSIGAGSARVGLAVVDAEDAERYALGIELDGQAYRSANTARERERLRVQVLEQLGWKIVRLRAQDWLKDPRAQVERILQRLSALDTPDDAWGPLTARAKSVERANGSGANDNTSPSSGTVIYTPVALPRLGTPEQFFRADASTIQDLFVKLAQGEGPIHWNAAARRIASSWGIPRVTPAVEKYLDPILSDLITQARVQFQDDFLSSPTMTQVTVRQPASGQEPRPIEEISLQEISQAGYLNLKNSLSLTPEDWVNLTAHLLGYPRATERVKRRIQTALDHLEATEIVKRQDGKLELKVL